MMVHVRDVMQSDVAALNIGAKAGDAARLLSNSKTGCVIITKEDAIIGIITKLDFVRKIISKGKNFDEPISQIVTSPAINMSPDMGLDEAIKIIDTKGFSKYPVIERGKIVGVVTKKDVVSAVSDNQRFHRNIQNLVLVLFVLFEFFVFVVYGGLYYYWM
jgi:CBS domain-containing protein